MQLIVFSCVSYELILALWNALKLFSATGLYPWSHTGGTPDLLKSVYSIKCLRKAHASGYFYYLMITKQFGSYSDSVPERIF